MSEGEGGGVRPHLEIELDPKLKNQMFGAAHKASLKGYFYPIPMKMSLSSPYLGASTYETGESHPVNHKEGGYRVVDSFHQ